MNRREFLKKSAAAATGFAALPGFRVPTHAGALGQRLSGRGPAASTLFHCQWGSFALPVNGQKATDALVVLKKSVASPVVCPKIRCDTDTSGTVVASDALRVLRVSVGQPIELTCPDVET